MPADYIPRSDAQMKFWAQTWLAALQQRSPDRQVTQELMDEAAATIAGYARALHDHQVAQNAAREARANKDAVRRDCEKVIRHVTNLLQASGISDADRAALGVRIPSRARRGALYRAGFDAAPPRVRIDASRHMEHLIGFTSSQNGFRKAKPRGAAGCEIWIAICDRPEQTPGSFMLLNRAVATPYRHQFGPGMEHKIAWYRLRWVDGYGRRGNWSQDVQTTIAV